MHSTDVRAPPVKRLVLSCRLFVCPFSTRGRLLPFTNDAQESSLPIAPRRNHTLQAAAQELGRHQCQTHVGRRRADGMGGYWSSVLGERLTVRIGLKQDGTCDLVSHLYAVSDPNHNRYGSLSDVVQRWLNGST